ADLVHVDGDLELVERGADTVRGGVGRLADDGHARGVSALGFADGERDDVDVEPAEEGRHAGEDAGLVLNEGYERMEHCFSLLLRLGGLSEHQGCVAAKLRNRVPDQIPGFDSFQPFERRKSSVVWVAE